MHTLRHTAAALALALVSSAALAGTAAETVRIGAPYVRAVPQGQPNSAAFMTLTNTDGQAHRVVRAESPAAEVVELHEHQMVGGMMQMRKVEQIDLPAGQTVDLQPGGLHVMLIQLTKELVANDEAAVSLVFEDGSRADLTLPVRAPQGQMPMNMDQGSHAGHMQHAH
jgi:periplasmic copper chaperone A